MLQKDYLFKDAYPNAIILKVLVISAFVTALGLTIFKAYLEAITPWLVFVYFSIWLFRLYDQYRLDKFAITKQKNTVHRMAAFLELGEAIKKLLDSLNNNNVGKGEARGLVNQIILAAPHVTLFEIQDIIKDAADTLIKLERELTQVQSRDVFVIRKHEFTLSFRKKEEFDVDHSVWPYSMLGTFWTL